MDIVLNGRCSKCGSLARGLPQAVGDDKLITWAKVLTVVCCVILAMTLPGLGKASSIAAVVNGKVISQYDAQNRAALLRLAGGGKGSASSIKSAALEELINEQIQTQAAKRFGVTVSKAAVDSAFNGIARGSKLTPTQFSQAMRQSGVKPSELRKRLAAQIMWGQAVQLYHSSKAGGLEKYGDLGIAKNSRGGISYRYDIRRIIFVVPSKSSRGRWTQRNKQANSFRLNRSVSCANLPQKTRGLRDVVVQNVGIRVSREIPGQIEVPLSRLSPGQMSKPERTDRGFEILIVCAKTALGGTRPSGSGNNFNQKIALELEQSAKELMGKLRKNSRISKR